MPGAVPHRFTGGITRRRWLATAAGTFALPSLASLPMGAAPPWPRGSVKILVAYPPGGVSDLVARWLAQQLATPWGVPVLVENKPGASGTLALELLARSAPDGQTLVFAAATAVGLAWAAARRKTHGEPPMPVTPIAGVMRTPMLLVGTPALRASTFGQMLDVARRMPGGIRWATTGEGTTGHEVLRRIERASGVRIVHAPYKGGGQQLTDALGGHFEVLSTNVAPRQLQALQNGQFKALAVGAQQRVPALPEVPTLAELGYAQANLDSLFGLFAPRHVPPERVEQISASIAQALQSTTIRDRLLAASNLPFDGSAADFAQQVMYEIAR